MASPNGAQSVRVAAASQYYELEIAASLAIGGTVGVAVPVTVRIVNIDTYAYIGSGAKVRAKNDISVVANGSESVVGVTAGAGGGTVGVAGTVAVTVVNLNTFACTGTPTTPAYKCIGNGATLKADNNVYVAANDSTRFVLVTASVAGGFVGVGLAVGVAKLTKAPSMPGSLPCTMLSGQEMTQAGGVAFLMLVSVVEVLSSVRRSVVSLVTVVVSVTSVLLATDELSL